jgi:cyclic pyranopterin phosphate synthase
MPFTHIDENGKTKMVDVSEKKETLRIAKAQALLKLSQNVFQAIYENKIPKGNVLETAKIAGILAAKNTHNLIPMCHPLKITNIKIDFVARKKNYTITIFAEIKAFDKTGVEMEALTACSVAALTIYDMCKALDKTMIISHIMLLQKSGGKSGNWKRKSFY